VLETGGYYRVGGTRLQRSNVRFIAATHRDLAALRDQGRFRADLYYRIDVFRIHIPPLRDRREDIPVITRHFVKVLRRQGVKSAASAFSASALRQLTEYDWPGNVRELRNVIWRAMVQATEPLIQLHDLTLG
jgi:DNA-binding NtrC family response regulator